MDIGYALTRDGCGKDSKEEEIARSWDRKALADVMNEHIKEELLSLKESGRDVFSVKDKKKYIVELREKPYDLLISYYEIKEVTQQ